MQTTVYLDQNVIIALSQSGQDSLLAHVRGGALRPVLSPTHWVEAARAPTSSEALRLAETMDSLRAFWLRERRELQRRELRAWAKSKPRDITIIEPICQTASEAAADLTGLQGATAVLTSTTIVPYLRANSRFGTIMKSAERSNAEGFERNVEHVCQGELTLEREEEIWVTWLCSVASEARTSSSRDQLRTAEHQILPSILTEFEIAKENWKRGVDNPDMRLSPQRLADVFHIVAALPYVDYVVSADNRLRKLIECVRPKLPFRTPEPVESLAELLEKA